MPRAKKSKAARPSTGPATKVTVLSRDVEHAKQVRAEEAAHVARATEYQRDADEAKALGLNVDPRTASLNAAHEQARAEAEKATKSDKDKELEAQAAAAAAAAAKIDADAAKAEAAKTVQP